MAEQVEHVPFEPVPQEVLTGFLAALEPNLNSNATDKTRIGLDSCLLPTRFDNLSIIQTVDFFYPLIDDPYLMGKITCANVLSDLYATGVIEVDKLQMVLSISTELSEQERDVVIPLVIKGFKDNAKSVGVTATVTSAAINPWCMMGGIATSVCSEKEYINPLNAQVGDALILTKPLGTHMACTVNRWMENPERWKKISQVVNEIEVKDTYNKAVASMMRLNRKAAELMHKYGAHGATDVTGFGLLGHAKNLVEFQTNNVKFSIHTLPIVKYMLAVSEVTGNKQKLVSGLAPETSGGLLICLPEGVAEDYCSEIYKSEGCKAWIIGKVEEGNKTAEISKDVLIVEV
ncbi:hypothetical protein ILUMI_21781 [Ignelater luminosus]|uniref:Selenide, water dikinase n=1 Tax=Ignelater luminosus TaxID=2038154 RepID=A0A8K0CFM9_IGNLU|nr:hypothetical protein ILUMI_21781 [Ignelater luminosus]